MFRARRPFELQMDIVLEEATVRSRTAQASSERDDSRRFPEKPAVVKACSPILATLVHVQALAVFSATLRSASNPGPTTPPAQAEHSLPLSNSKTF